MRRALSSLTSPPDIGGQPAKNRIERKTKTLAIDPVLREYLGGAPVLPCVQAST